MSVPHYLPLRPAPFPTSFIVRVWRTEPAGEWRCLLIEVESGERLACGSLDHLGASIATWLSSHPPDGQTGIR